MEYKNEQISEDGEVDFLTMTRKNKKKKNRLRVSLVIPD